MKWTWLVILGCLLVGCGDDDPAGGGGHGGGGNADGGGGNADGGGGNADGGGGNADGGGGNADGGGGNADGGGGNADGGGGNADGGGGNANGGGGNADGGGGNADGGGGNDGNEGGGGHDGGDAVTLEMATDEVFSSGCATFVDGAWGVGETGFEEGEVVNLDCALVPVVVDGNPYWITSATFEGTLGLDELAYSFSTAEAPVVEGSERLVLTDAAFFGELFSGTVNVTEVTFNAVTITIE
ncbi:hypothetical protein [Sorangium sp. So ce131]|uniref:hypothetical protein n=1 Tax=Sorangium sp. So ce131 TaxID=3133282 RepID=UPI003F6014D1